ncbi:hypothetical protein E4U41_005484 [Claviceps citrina]|nr:hypothetical protein E4U41_005484 [Claviceps citrina]
MASSGSAGGSLPPNFLLTPHQQSLLFAALNANKQRSTSPPTANGLSLSTNMLPSPPTQLAEGAGVQESPYLDSYDYDFGDTSFDFSFASAGGDGAQATAHAVPGTVNSDSTEGEAHEKRSHPADEGDDSSLGNDPKRRESAEKVAKKPGRKPLTSEPASKRKAQNRAAQRAFRERKEKHLKDLESKVEELEKASEATSHENSQLRDQVDRMTAELNQYKQRLAVLMHNKPASREKTPLGDAAANNSGYGGGFQFEFPRFGALPGPPMSKPSTSAPTSPQQGVPNRQEKTAACSMDSQSKWPGPGPQRSNKGGDPFELGTAFARYTNGSTGTGTGSRASLDSVPFSVAAATSSPSASSNSNVGGPSSSCGTSPEPFTQSPMAFKPLETLTTIGEEQPATGPTVQPFSHVANLNMGSPSFDWLVQQHGAGSFDPQLFGDYREPQENVLSNPLYDDIVLNDNLDADFLTPFNAAPTIPPPKKNLIAEIDAQQDALDKDESKQPLISCHQVWQKLQACPKTQTTDFDLDGLCSELTKKAKCSGSGPVVNERDFDSILQKYVAKDARADCVADKLGIGIAVKSDGPDGVVPTP